MEHNLEERQLVESFFYRHPQALVIFDRLQEEILALGEITIEVQKSQISFGSRSKFAWAWLPRGGMKRAQEDNLAFTFGLDYPVADPRMYQVVNPYPNRYTHHLLLRSPNDCDDQLRRWLQESYAFAQTRRGRTSK